jgi:hypothetical protein
MLLNNPVPKNFGKAKSLAPLSLDLIYNQAVEYNAVVKIATKLLRGDAIVEPSTLSVTEK